jgi:DnaJ-class molecular chaperone
MKKNPFDILGIPKNSDKSIVKKAYHKLALQFHPDKNNNSDAADKFKEISQAYAEICNPQSIHEEFPDLSEIFSFFGNIFNKGGNDMDINNISNFTGLFPFINPKGPSIHATLDLTLEEIYKGGEFNVQYEVKHYTNELKQVSILQKIGPVEIEEVMFIPDSVIKKENTKVNIPKGWNTDNPLIIKELIKQPNNIHSDLHIEIFQKNHKVFKRQGNDLIATLNISIKEALLGFKRTIVQLDSRELDINCNSIIGPYDTKIIPEEGINTKGNLIIQFHIDFPKNLKDTDKNIIENLTI